MRMDLVKARYETYDELYEYCYKVAGTVGLMTTPVMGVDPTYKVSNTLPSAASPAILNFAVYTTALPSVLSRQSCTARGLSAEPKEQ